MTPLFRPRSAFLFPLALIGLACAGCAPTLDATYGKSRGTSLNGTSVLTKMLRDRQREVRAAIRLNDELAAWARAIIRFAPYPGPPSLEESRWYRDWLAADGGRLLVYVVRDFDTVAEYWQGVRATLTESSDEVRRAEAEEKRNAAANWVDKLPAKANPGADPRCWFGTDTAWNPPRACTRLSGPWADGIDAAAAGLIVHEPLKTARGLRLLECDGKPLVIEKGIGRGRVLMIGNGSFLLNEAIVNPARRPLAERAIDWVCASAMQVALVEGPFVLAGDAEPPTIWSLMRRISSLRWVAIQVGLAALMAALARASRLGRPRPDPPSGANRPAEHAAGLGDVVGASESRARGPGSPRSLPALAVSSNLAGHGDSSRFHGRWCPVPARARG